MNKLYAIFNLLFSIDYRALAAFRIGLSLLVIANLALLAPDLEGFYTNHGIMPLAQWPLATEQWHWSLYVISGWSGWPVLLFTLSAGVAALMAVGYRTRLMSILTWVLLVSLVNRNHFILQAGDQLLVILAFWSMFLPLNARWSVDAALDQKHQDKPDSAVVEHASQYFSVATVAVILQVLYLYFFTALLKTDASWRVTFDAAFYAVSLEHFATRLGTFISEFPALLKLGTAYVLAVEFIAPLLALSPAFHTPLRLVAVALLFSLHIAFLFALHIGLFPLIDFVALLLLIPAVAWNALGGITINKQRWQQKSAICLYYDEDCGFCQKMTLLFRALFLPAAVRIIPAQSVPPIGEVLERENSWVVTDHAGRQYLHWHAVQFVIAQSVWSKPLAWILNLPPLMYLGNRLYSSIGTNRTRLGAISARFLPYRSVHLTPTLPGQLIAAFFLYAVTVTNLTSVKALDIKAPAYVSIPIMGARLDQRWGMFAPKPLVYSLYPVVEGSLRDGTAVDLFGNADFDETVGPANRTPPFGGYDAYPGYRWRKVFERVNGGNERLRRAYGQYLCREWNHAGRSAQKQLATVDMLGIRLRTNTIGDTKKLTEHALWQHWCFPEFAPKA